jgi:membrane protease YdiL (CAAX protease family)
MIPFERTAMLRESNTQKGLSAPLEILCFLAVFLFGQLLAAIPAGLTALILTVKNTNIGEAVEPNRISESDLILLVSLFSMVLLTLTVIVFSKLFQGRTVASLGLRRSGALVEYVAGLGIGILLFGATLGICLATGSANITRGQFSLIPWLLFLIGFLIQGMSEEVLCRGYFLPTVARRHSLVWAIVTNSLLFSLLHGLNNGVEILAFLNIFLFGVLSSLYMLRRGNIWGICAIHSIWNFVQGNVFGLNVSGIHTGHSLFKTSLPSEKSLFNGGAFGPEGSLAATAVLTVGILILLFFVPNAKSDDKQPSEGL